MFKYILAGLLLGSALPVMADPIGEDDYYSNHSLGCMLLKECHDGVEKINSSADLRRAYPNSDWNSVADEFDRILVAFNQIGVDVHLADEKYFPVGHRGVYHTVSNHFYLNRTHVHRPNVLMSVVRHEGWHAAQDCMAGTIDNSLIAIIKPEDDVPKIWQEMVQRTYAFQPSAIPWEKEATWAGKTEGMTQAALESCARGTMWTDYDPTPMTREWLENNGYIK
jgi:hypothetical protein